MYTQKLKFQRRTDLSVQKRILIAYIVLYQYFWGSISNLSRKYNVSRPFIYQEVEKFSAYCNNYFESNNIIIDAKDNSLKYILSLRMDGKCSIPSISQFMTRLNLPNHSVGYISQTLNNIGKKLGNKLDISNVEGFIFSICSDEIFASGQPILVTVDPVNLLILNIELSDNRKAEAWVNHWQAIKSQGVKLSMLINDEGLGMKAAKEIELADIDRQSDTFHAVAHRLGMYSNRLLSIAYKAIKQEYDCSQLLSNSKTETTQNKRREKYESAKANAKEAIELYDNFVFLYHCLLECFQAFDKQGNLKNIEEVKLDFDTALEFIIELKHKEINEEVKSIEQCKTDLFTFYKSAKNITTHLSQKIDIEILKLFCLAWQCRKNSIKAKDSHRKQKYNRREKYILQDVKELIDDQYETIKKIVYEQLNHIIQSSAAVECINSLLRPYLNTSKNHVTQEFLNLFMFYHNHRCFKFGERKGKSPMQIATMSENQHDWLDLLLLKQE